MEKKFGEKLLFLFVFCLSADTADGLLYLRLLKYLDSCCGRGGLLHSEELDASRPDKRDVFQSSASEHIPDV